MESARNGVARFLLLIRPCHLGNVREIRCNKLILVAMAVLIFIQIICHDRFICRNGTSTENSLELEK